MTAAFALYDKLGLPQPWHPATESTPLVIYGAATAVGSYAVQLAVRSNIRKCYPDIRSSNFSFLSFPSL